EVNYHILGHYDAMMIILNAIAKDNINSHDIKKYLENMSSYNGYTGKIIFDSNGGASLPLYLYTINNNKFCKYEGIK
ncbi:MAG: hypothetical protein K8R44_06425, partial [Sulfurimonas sp.]|nr:hypothetical protein [Sulfurimonas sp.]